MAACDKYLREIMAQYQSGKRDDLAYRTARRNAHNADAALSTALTSMFQEPGFVQGQGDGGLRFLLLSHTLLNYLSGLGAHREALSGEGGDAPTQHAAAHVADVLDHLAQSLVGRVPVQAAHAAEPQLIAALQATPTDAPPALRLVQSQLALIGELLTPLRVQAARLLKQEPAAHETTTASPD